LRIEQLFELRQVFLPIEKRLHDNSELFPVRTVSRHPINNSSTEQVHAMLVEFLTAPRPRLSVREVHHSAAPVVVERTSSRFGRSRSLAKDLDNLEGTLTMFVTTLVHLALRRLARAEVKSTIVAVRWGS
jgi:hypothetical protein